MDPISHSGVLILSIVESRETGTVLLAVSDYFCIGENAAALAHKLLQARISVAVSVPTGWGANDLHGGSHREWDSVSPLAKCGGEPFLLDKIERCNPIDSLLGLTSIACWNTTRPS